MEHDIRIIALDLDGTLLDSSKRLSPANRQALEHAAARGIAIVPTTGRFFDMIPAAVRNLPFIRYAITINGAAAYDRATRETLVREEIPLEMAVHLLAALDKYDVIADCYRNNWGWITAALQQKAPDYATDEHYLRMIREFRRPVPDLKDHLRATAAEGGVQKVMLFATNRNPVAAARNLSAIRNEVARDFPQIRVTSSGYNNLEFNIETAHKGGTLARLATYLGCTLADCLAIGDGLNDFTMIRDAGIGVAMANAIPEVKAVADFVTATNDEDGVAKALARFA